MNKTLMMLACVGALFALVGCRTAPIQNVPEKTVYISDGQSVERAILTGGTRRGWAMKKVHTGLVRGVLVHGNHTVTVDIPYTDDSYSIQYADSTNMKYNAKKNSIHKNFNRWLIYLDRSIRKELLSQQKFSDRIEMKKAGN